MLLPLVLGWLLLDVVRLRYNTEAHLFRDTDTKKPDHDSIYALMHRTRACNGSRQSRQALAGIWHTKVYLVYTRRQ